MVKQVTDEIKDEIRACITDKKNPDKCIDGVLEEHDIDVEQKAKILTKMLKEDK
ncbi:MAG: hypothetical protein IMZ53_10905 [Thermoplasmata archaeon]|nr:hypothetical protein [Thermoplasmata archaeon]MBE3141076.1 hypothetical protein [Thermoplasmata archaeon]